MHSLELPQRGNSNEYIQHTIARLENFHKYLFSGALEKNLQGVKTKFESAMVNEQSAFELLRLNSSVDRDRMLRSMVMFCGCDTP